MLEGASEAATGQVVRGGEIDGWGVGIGGGDGTHVVVEIQAAAVVGHADDLHIQTQIDGNRPVLAVLNVHGEFLSQQFFSTHSDHLVEIFGTAACRQKFSAVGKHGLGLYIAVAFIEGELFVEGHVIVPQTAAVGLGFKVIFVVNVLPIGVIQILCVAVRLEGFHKLYTQKGLEIGFFHGSGVGAHDYDAFLVAVAEGGLVIDAGVRVVQSRQEGA